MIPETVGRRDPGFVVLTARSTGTLGEQPGRKRLWDPHRSRWGVGIRFGRVLQGPAAAVESGALIVSADAIRMAASPSGNGYDVLDAVGHLHLRRRVVPGSPRGCPTGPSASRLAHEHEPAVHRGRLREEQRSVEPADVPGATLRGVGARSTARRARSFEESCRPAMPGDSECSWSVRATRLLAHPVAWREAHRARALAGCRASWPWR